VKPIASKRRTDRTVKERMRRYRTRRSFERAVNAACASGMDWHLEVRKIVDNIVYAWVLHENGQASPLWQRLNATKRPGPGYSGSRGPGGRVTLRPLRPNRRVGKGPNPRARPAKARKK